MVDPFAAALASIFRSPLAIPADYQVGGADPVPLRVIRSQPDEEIDRRDSRYVLSTNQFQIQRSDIPAPAAGARLRTYALDAGGNPTILTGTFELVGEPMLDVEGVSHNCGAVEVE